MFKIGDAKLFEKYIVHSIVLFSKWSRSTEQNILPAIKLRIRTKAYTFNDQRLFHKINSLEPLMHFQVYKNLIIFYSNTPRL